MVLAHAIIHGLIIIEFKTMSKEVQNKEQNQYEKASTTENFDIEWWIRPKVQLYA